MDFRIAHVLELNWSFSVLPLQSTSPLVHLGYSGHARANQDHGMGSTGLLKVKLRRKLLDCTGFGRYLDESDGFLRSKKNRMAQNDKIFSY